MTMLRYGRDVCVCVCVYSILTGIDYAQRCLTYNCHQPPSKSPASWGIYVCRLSNASPAISLSLPSSLSPSLSPSLPSLFFIHRRLYAWSVYNHSSAVRVCVLQDV
jgi:hypothetical protein